MALTEDLEQQLRPGLGERDVAQFVDDQQLCGGQVLLQPQQSALVARILELVDEAGGGDKGNGETALTRGQAQSQRNVGLPGAAVAEHDDVVAGNDELAARQLQYQGLVEAGHGGEVEGIQALHRREAGIADTPLDQTALAVDQLQLGQTQQITGMIDALPGALAGHLLVSRRKVGSFSVFR